MRQRNKGDSSDFELRAKTYVDTIVDVQSPDDTASYEPDQKRREPTVRERKVKHTRGNGTSVKGHHARLHHRLIHMLNTQALLSCLPLARHACVARSSALGGREITTGLAATPMWGRTPAEKKGGERGGCCFSQNGRLSQPPSSGWGPRSQELACLGGAWRLAGTLFPSSRVHCYRPRPAGIRRPAGRQFGEKSGAVVAGRGSGLMQRPGTRRRTIWRLPPPAALCLRRLGPFHPSS